MSDKIFVEVVEGLESVDDIEKIDVYRHEGLYVGRIENKMGQRGSLAVMLILLVIKQAGILDQNKLLKV